MLSIPTLRRAQSYFSAALTFETGITGQTALLFVNLTGNSRVTGQTLDSRSSRPTLTCRPLTRQLTHPRSDIFPKLNNLICSSTYNSVHQNVPAGTYVKFSQYVFNNLTHFASGKILKGNPFGGMSPEVAELAGCTNFLTILLSTDRQVASHVTGIFQPRRNRHSRTDLKIVFGNVVRVEIHLVRLVIRG